MSFLKQTHFLHHAKWRPNVHDVRCTLRSDSLKFIVMLHPAKWHVHGCCVDAPCDLARQLTTSISSRFGLSAQLLRGLVVSLFSGHFLAAMPSRKVSRKRGYCSLVPEVLRPKEDLATPRDNCASSRVASLAFQGQRASGKGWVPLERWMSPGPC
jgi:hypothetical protein